MTKHSVILKITNILLKILIIMFIIGCTKTVNYNLSLGYYVSQPKNKIKIFYNSTFLNSYFTIGDTLILLENDRFKHRSCGGIEYGNYYTKRDSLYLNVDSFYYFKSKKFEHYKYQTIFQIENENILVNKFISRSSLDTNSEKSTSIRELKFIGK